jgi:MFS family permease
MYSVGAAGFVLLGLLVLYGVHSPTFGLIATLVAVGLFAVAAGAGDPHYMEIVVASVSLKQRGRYFGVRGLCVGLGGIAGGALTGVALYLAPTPRDFGYCILAGGLLFAGSTFVLLCCRDNPAPAERHASFRDFLCERIIPLVRRKQFRWYLISISCFALAACGLPFLPLLIKEKLHASEDIYGWLGGLAMGSNLVIPWILGIICDHWGSRRGFMAVLLLYTIGVLGCLFLEGYTALFISYLLASIWLPGSIVSMTNLALKIAPDVPTSEVFSTKMVSMAPAQILGPVLVGAAIDHWSYGPALWACVGCVALALIALWRCGPVAQ